MSCRSAKSTWATRQEYQGRAGFVGRAGWFSTTIFVHTRPAPAGAAGGEYDDMLVWLPVGVLYSRLIAAGVLP